MTQLKSGYKLMYENRDMSGTALEQHLRATKTFPATADANVTYKEVEGGAVIADPKSFIRVIQEGEKFFGSTTAYVADAKEFCVYSGNDLLLGRAVQ